MATVLLVDDVDGRTKALKRELRQLGYQVVSAAAGAGGLEAVAVAETWRPDVVLLEVSMSQADAIEACRRLSAAPVLCATPIILISSKEEEPRLTSGLEAGAFDCITRPFSTTVLSARVRSAVRMKRAQETIQATARLRSDLLETASDELRTPVAAILDVTDNLLEPDRSEEERRRAINSIRQSGDHLLQIVNDISDVSRIEAGKLDVKLVDCSPPEIITDVIKLLGRRAQAHGIGLCVDYPQTVPRHVRSDPVRLRRILVNLVSNALRFTDTGTVNIVATREGGGSLGEALRLEISDGAPATAGEETGAFRSYAGVDPSALRDRGATGLALAVSNRLSELLGGELSVACTVRRGCVVRVSVPVCPPEENEVATGPPVTAREETAPRPARAADVRLEGCRVLIAEDDPSLQESLSRVLTDAGAVVTVAVDGPAAASLALAAAAAGRTFATIVIEMHLTALSGEPAVEILRRRGYLGSILGLTTGCSPAERERCLGAGCNEVLAKPVDITALVVAVRAQLSEGVPVNSGAANAREGMQG